MHDAPAALLFDVFGTVVDWRAGIIRELQAFGARLAIERDWEALAERWRGQYQPSMERVRRGELPWTVLDDLHLASLRVLLAGEGIDAPDDDVVWLSEGWRRLDPWPDSVLGLARLRAGAVVAALSNGNIALMVALARHGGLVWDAILGAEPARAYKPDPAVYLTAASILRLAPERCLMVAAHSFDLRAARACGLRTAFIERPHEFGPRGAERAEEGWDWVARDLLDLADQLSATSP